jgi:uncharacterized protein (TIGR03435 family)
LVIFVMLCRRLGTDFRHSVGTNLRGLRIFLQSGTKMLNQNLIGVTLSLLFVTTATFGQTGPTFDVASIKKAEPLSIDLVRSGKMKIGMVIDAAQVNINSMSIAEMLRAAYKVKSFQVSGPDWMAQERWNIVAKMPAGASRDQVPEMLQALLADRFKLALHHSTTEQAVYALVVTKSGKLPESAPEDNPAPMTPGGPAAPLAPTPTDGGAQVRASATSDASGNFNMNSINGNAKMVPRENGMRIEITKMNMTGMLELLGRFVERPVVDATGLKGRYDLNIDVGLEDMLALARAAGMNVPVMPNNGGAAEPGSSSVFAAIQPYGLKLEPRKASIDMLVIDHLEKTPTEN